MYSVHCNASILNVIKLYQLYALITRINEKYLLNVFLMFKQLIISKWLWVFKHLKENFNKNKFVKKTSEI